MAREAITNSRGPDNGSLGAVAVIRSCGLVCIRTWVQVPPQILLRDWSNPGMLLRASHTWAHEHLLKLYPGTSLWKESRHSSGARPQL
jgi:hypothetical protein